MLLPLTADTFCLYRFNIICCASSIILILIIDRRASCNQQLLYICSPNITITLLLVWVVIQFICILPCWSEGGVM